MDFSSFFSGGNFNDMASGLVGLYGGAQGANTANNVNQQVQGNIGQNNAVLQGQIGTLQSQIAADRQRAQEAYDRSSADVTGQNAQLQGNINTMTGSLNALSDPNSSYMQNARQAIERQDAAAGRRSQWGERETQLAGTLADYVGKYSPGLNNSITAGRNQINQNNQGLASLFSNMNNPSDRNQQALAQLLQQSQNLTTQMNTTGRQAANSATNNTTGLVNSGIKALSGLGGLYGSLFGGGGSSNNSNPWSSGGWGTTNGYDWSDPAYSGGVIEGLGSGYYNTPDYGTMSDTGDPYSSYGDY